MLSKHIKRTKLSFDSTWRKIAVHSWRRPLEPSVYGVLKLDATKFAAFLEQNKSISSTQLFAKVAANALAKHPQINVLIANSSLYQRESLDVFLQVAVDKEGKELSGLVIQNADKKSVFEISKELKLKALSIRKGEDKGFKQVKKSLSFIPPFLTRFMLKLLDIILYDLNIYSNFLGIQRDPFGSFMVTNTSSFGVDHGFVPLPAIARIPLIFSMFDLKDEVVVEHGEMVIRPILTVTATLDHRVIDGVYAGKLVQSIKEEMSLL